MIGDRNLYLPWHIYIYNVCMYICAYMRMQKLMSCTEKNDALIHGHILEK